VNPDELVRRIVALAGAGRFTDMKTELQQGMKEARRRAMESGVVAERMKGEAALAAMRGTTAPAGKARTAPTLLKEAERVGIKKGQEDARANAPAGVVSGIEHGTRQAQIEAELTLARMTDQEPRTPPRTIRGTVAAAVRAGGKLTAKAVVQETLARVRRAVAAGDPVGARDRSPLDLVIGEAYAKGATEETERIKKRYKRFVANLEDERLDMQDKMRGLGEYLREMPETVRARSLPQLKRLAWPKTKAARQRHLEIAIEIIDREWRGYARRETILRINQKLESIKAKKDPRRGIPISKLADKKEKKIQAILAQIHAAMWLDQERVDTAISKLVDATDEGSRDFTGDEKTTLVILQRFGHLRGKTLEELKWAETQVDRVIKEGRMEHEAQEERRLQEMATLRERAMHSFTGGKGPMAISARLRHRSRHWLKRIGDALRTFDDWHQSWEWMLDKLERFSGSNPLGGDMTVYFRDLAHQATHSENSGTREWSQTLTSKLHEIHGVRGWRLQRILETNATERTEKSGVHRYRTERMPDGTERTVAEELPLTQNEAYYLWQKFFDASQSENMQSNGFTEKTAEELEAFLKPETREWALWLMTEFFPTHRKGVNDVFKRMFYTDLPEIANYTPIVREYESQKDDDPFLGQKSSVASVISGHLKSRTETSRPVKIVDGDDLLMRYVVQMEHFKAWAEAVREMRSVLGAERVLKAIEDYHGPSAKRVVMAFVGQFSAGGSDRAMAVRGLDRLRANFTRAVLSINPVVFLKQLTSIPAYMMDIPVSSWAAGVADFFRHPAEVAQILMRSEMMRGRYDIGFERDIVLAMKSATSGKLAGRRRISDIMMALISFGDAGAIIIGGWPVYRYHYNRARQGGKSDAESKEIANREFGFSTERTQQAGGIKDLGQIQQAWGSWGRLFTMFMTSPTSYYRQMTAALRNARAGRGLPRENARRFIIAAFVLPIVFQFIASGFRWDDEDQMEALLNTPFNGLAFARDLANGVFHAMIDGRSREFTGSPVFDVVMDFSRAGGDVHQLVEKGLDKNEIYSILDHLAVGGSKFAGAPYEPAKRLIDGLADAVTGNTEKPLRRVLGFSEAALEGPDE
jgi:hypothetical protein